VFGRVPARSPGDRHGFCLGFVTGLYAATTKGPQGGHPPTEVGLAVVAGAKNTRLWPDGAKPPPGWAEPVFRR
jgi:hypothetical protein